MTIHFVGGEMGSFVPSNSDVYEYSSASFNSAFARCALLCDGSTSYAETPSIASLTDAWLHCDIKGGTGAIGNVIIWYDGSGTERVRLYINHDTSNMKVEYDVGAGWVSAGSITVDVRSLNTMDLNVLCDTASGSIKMYLSGTLRIDSGTIDLSAITELNKIRLYGTSYVGLTREVYYSQVIVADEPTIGMRLLTRYMNGAGSTSDWTGGYTDVDEITYSDADFCNSSTNGQVELFTQTGPAISGYTVRAVGVYARAKRGASGPSNLQLALRSSGTNYFSSSKALDLGYGAFGNIWDTNPATSADWLSSAIDALQPGMKAVT